MSRYEVAFLLSCSWLYGVGAAIESIRKRRYPKKERAGRIALWPLFALLWIVVAIVTGLRTFAKAAVGASEQVEADDDDEDEKDDDE
jgi:polyferredoxin